MQSNATGESYNKARKRVRELKAFYTHVMGYAAVIILLILINLTTSPGYLWFVWPMFGLSVSVVIHGMKVFHFLPFLGEDWEQRKIKELMESKTNGNSI